MKISGTHYRTIWRTASGSVRVIDQLIAGRRYPSVARDIGEYIARAAFMDTLFQDMLGFGACKMIRRILGFAHVLDLDGIANPDVRADCERAALAMAATLLRHPEHFKSIEDVTEAVPRLQPRSR